MQEREPGTLLKALLHALSTRGVGIQHALFVPPDSRYTQVAKLKEDQELDLGWQIAIRNKWESFMGANVPQASKVITLLYGCNFTRNPSKHTATVWSPRPMVPVSFMHPCSEHCTGLQGATASKDFPFGARQQTGRSATKSEEHPFMDSELQAAEPRISNQGILLFILIPLVAYYQGIIVL